MTCIFEAFAGAVAGAVSHPGTSYGVLEEGAAVRALTGIGQVVTYPGTVWGDLQQGAADAALASYQPGFRR